MTDILEIKEGTQYMTSDEVKIYRITTTNVDSSNPSSATVKVYDESVDEEVTSAVMAGGNPDTPSNNVIILKALGSTTKLTKDHSYRVEVLFTVGSNIHECWFVVKCIR